MSDKAKEIEQQIRQYADQLIEAVNEMASPSEPEDDGWKTVGEHGQPPNGVIYVCDHCPTVVRMSHKHSPTWISDVKYRILRTAEETKAFLNGEPQLPIDSDEHEWRSASEWPDEDRWVVVRFDSFYEKNNGCCKARAVKRRSDIQILDDKWDDLRIQDWRYCTPKEVRGE